jgi:hypothetical protein
VAHTTHAHNETIVNQGACPANLNLHEQLAFSNLRCGSHLQWKNIARELRANVLTFSREEVHTLITQAAWQIGPLSDDGLSREWHFELGVPDFGLVLIREAMDLLLRVEANWTEGTTIKSISMSPFVSLNKMMHYAYTDVQFISPVASLLPLQMYNGKCGRMDMNFCVKLGTSHTSGCAR